MGKGNRSAATTYYGYPLVDQGVPVTAGLAPADYATDFLAREAAAFVRTAPASQPYFLLFTPSAPHAPQTPAPRYADAFDGLELPRPPSFGVSDVEGKPPWIRDLPPIGPGRAAALDAARIRERQTLLAVDDAVRHRRFTLVVFAHPQCPCSRATIEELARIVSCCSQKRRSYSPLLRTVEFASVLDQNRSPEHCCRNSWPPRARRYGRRRSQALSGSHVRTGPAV